MTGIDISKIKPGDEVTFKATVMQQSEPRGLMLDFRDEFGQVRPLRVAASAIVSHTPKALAVGDRVFGVTTKRGGVVIATHEDLSWVKFEDGKHEVVFPDQVERVS